MGVPCMSQFSNLRGRKPAEAAHQESIASTLKKKASKPHVGTNNMIQAPITASFASSSSSAPTVFPTVPLPPSPPPPRIVVQIEIVELLFEGRSQGGLPLYCRDGNGKLQYEHLKVVDMPNWEDLPSWKRDFMDQRDFAERIWRIVGEASKEGEELYERVQQSPFDGYTLTHTLITGKEVKGKFTNFVGPVDIGSEVFQNSTVSTLIPKVFKRDKDSGAYKVYLCLKVDQRAMKLQVEGEEVQEVEEVEEVEEDQPDIVSLGSTLPDLDAFFRSREPVDSRPTTPHQTNTKRIASGSPETTRDRSRQRVGSIEVHATDEVLAGELSRASLEPSERGEPSSVGMITRGKGKAKQR
ncbi:MAG: hypothetical protein Q9165_007876 [Trypethelium subeluteriae]